MKKRFVVVSNGTTEAQDKVFQDWLSRQGLGWWHWLNETWLIVDATGTHDAEKIRTKALKCFPGIYLLVLELTSTGDTWAGFGPSETDPEQNMFQWIQENW